MFGVLVNAVAIIIGSITGFLLKKGIPDKITGPIMTGISLCIIYIGVKGSLCGDNSLITIVSMVLGAITGTLLDIDGKLNNLGNTLENKIGSRTSSKNVSGFSKGFVDASIIFGVGAMAIIGSINAGLNKDYSVLYTKSLLDLISACIFTVSFGIGVAFSSVTIFVYQGAIALLAGFISPVLTESAINEMSCVGYILIMAIGFNMLKITKIKLADFLPAIIYAPVITIIIDNII